MLKVIQLSGAEPVVKFSLFRPHFFLLISFKIFIPLPMPSFEIVSCLGTWYTCFSLFKDYVLTFIWDPQVNTHGTFMIITRHAQGGGNIWAAGAQEPKCSRRWQHCLPISALYWKKSVLFDVCLDLSHVCQLSVLFAGNFAVQNGSPAKRWLLSSVLSTSRLDVSNAEQVCVRYASFVQELSAAGHQVQC